MGDLATAIEIAMGDGGGEGGGGGGGGGGGRGGGRESTWLFIDWKQAYRTLYQVMSRIKELVIQAGNCMCNTYIHVRYQLPHPQAPSHSFLCISVKREPGSESGT